MRVLDLFCNAGGAATGYARAGFEVVGVDINPQPNYPFEFIQADVFDLPARFLAQFDLGHGSPPCQHSAAITKGTNRHRQHLHPNLYPQTKALLERTGKPYVIENPDSRPDVVLCGEMFGLVSCDTASSSWATGPRRSRRFRSTGAGSAAPATARSTTARTWPCTARAVAKPPCRRPRRPWASIGRMSTRNSWRCCRRRTRSGSASASPPGTQSVPHDRHGPSRGLAGRVIPSERTP